MSPSRRPARLATSHLVWLVIGAFTLLATPSARAQSGGGGGAGFVGLAEGFALPNTSSITPCFAFNAAYKLLGNIGVGIFYQRYGISAELTSEPKTALVSTSTAFYGFEGAWYFTGTLANFNAGMKLGLAHSSLTGQASDGTTTVVIDETGNNLFVEPKVAYDYPIGRFSLGGQLSYVYGLGSAAPRAVMLMTTGKFWF